LVAEHTEYVLGSVGYLIDAMKDALFEGLEVLPIACTSPIKP